MDAIHDFIPHWHWDEDQFTYEDKLYQWKNGSYILNLENSDYKSLYEIESPSGWWGDFNMRNHVTEVRAAGSKLKELEHLRFASGFYGPCLPRDRKGKVILPWELKETYGYDWEAEKKNWPSQLYLKVLDISNTPIAKLPQLPEGLEELRATNCPNLKELPRLPKSLKELYVGGTPLTELPKLPPNLTHLDVGECPLRFFPLLPMSLYFLNVDGCTKLFLPRTVTVIPSSEGDVPPPHDMLRFVDGDEVPMYEIWEPVSEYRERSNSLWRARRRMAKLKERLVATVFHPSKVEKWLEIGGHELLDMMF